MTTQAIRKAFTSQDISVKRVHKVSFTDLARGEAYFVKVGPEIRGDSYRKAQAIAKTISTPEQRIIVEA